METFIERVEILYKSDKNEESPIQNARTRRGIAHNSDFMSWHLHSEIDNYAIQFAKLDLDTIRESVIFRASKYAPVLQAVMILNDIHSHNLDNIAQFFKESDVLCRYKTYIHLKDNQINFLRVKYIINQFESEFEIFDRDPIPIKILIYWIAAVIGLWDFIQELS